MNIRGDLKIHNDLYVKTAEANAEVGKLLYAAGVDGKLFWQNLKLYEAVSANEYKKGSIVIDSPYTFVYIALVDGALGSEILDIAKWKVLIDVEKSGGGAGSDHLYYISTDVGDAEVPEDVGGVLDTYDVAAKFRDGSGEPNQPVSAVLDAILFPLVTPAKIANESVSVSITGKRTGDSTYRNLANKLISVEEAVDVNVVATYTPGLWNSGQPYLGSAIDYIFNKNGVSETLQVNSTTDTISAPSGTASFSYSTEVNHGIGGIPTDSRGTSYPLLQQPASPPNLVSPLVLVAFGYPILMAMLGDKKVTASELSTYLNAQSLVTLTTDFDGGGSDGLFISATTVATNVTSVYVGTGNYPYLLLPVEYGKSLLNFTNTSTNDEYNTNFDVFPSVNITIGGQVVQYAVYVFKTDTTIGIGSDLIELTIG